MINREDYEEVKEKVDVFLLTSVELFLTYENFGYLKCEQITNDNKEYMEEMFQKMNYAALPQEFNNIKTSHNSSLLTKLIMELIFEKFFLDESFFSTQNNQNSFYFLILILK